MASLLFGPANSCLHQPPRFTNICLAGPPASIVWPLPQWCLVYSQTRQQLMLGSFTTALTGAPGCTDSGSILSPISCLLPSVNCRLHNLATILEGLIQLLMTQLTALVDGRAGNPPPCLGIPLPPGAACMVLHSPQLLLLIRLLEKLAGRRVLFLRARARGCRAQ